MTYNIVADTSEEKLADKTPPLGSHDDHLPTMFLDQAADFFMGHEKPAKDRSRQ